MTKKPSNSDLFKSKNEETAFSEAVKLGIKAPTITCHILKYLNGEKIRRNSDNNPDIVRICSKGKNNTKTLVGIEHFRVDQLSKRKKGTIISTAKETLSHVDDIIAEGKKEQTNSGDISSQTAEKLLKKTSDFVKDAFVYGYNEFIESFKYSLYHHIDRYDNYIQNLTPLSNGLKIELALFLDINSLFPSFYYFENWKYTENTDGLAPVFEDMVLELEKIDKNKFKYLILFMRNSVPFSSKPYVIALRTGNIRKQLKTQRITIYRYYGLNSFDKGEIRTSFANGNYNEKFILTRSFFEQLNNNPSIIKSVIESKRNNVPFVTTREVLHFTEVFRDYLVFQKDTNGNLKMKIPLDIKKNEIIEKETLFLEKFPQKNK